MKKREYIICAANHYDDGIEHVHQPKNIRTGVVLAGRRHHNIIHNFCILTGETKGDQCTQGFLTSNDRFVDRVDGYKIAQRANQVKGDIRTTKKLYSEDLY